MTKCDMQIKPIRKKTSDVDHVCVFELDRDTELEILSADDW